MVGIVILNYNNASATIACVESIIRYNTYPVKIIIVDNGSKRSDVIFIDNYVKSFQDYKKYDERDKMPEILPHYMLLVSSTNDGYAQGNNKGIKVFDKDREIDNILILNNDVLFYEDIIGTLVQFQDGKDNKGIVSPILYTKDKTEIDYTCARKSPPVWNLLLRFILMDLKCLGFSEMMDSNYYLIKQDKTIIDRKFINIDLPSGSCMLIDKGLFKSIGWFDKHTFLYYEENILYKKLLAYDKQNYIIPSIGCIHLGASSTKSKPSSFLIKCYSDSAFYYLSHYCHLNFLQKILFLIAKKMMRIKYLIFKQKEKQK